MGYIGNSNPSVTNLGGDIDVNGHQIKSSSNGNIEIVPDGSGTVKIDVLTFPVADGSNGQFLQTNGSGVLSFSTPSGGIASVAADSTPQLGGNLDVNGNDIVSTSNANIEILPNGSGKVHLDGNGSSGGVLVSDGLIEIKTGTGSVGEVRFYCESSNAHYVSLKSPAHSSYSGNVVLTLPATDGDAGEYLKTDGSGVLSWDTPSGGGGGGFSQDSNNNLVAGTDAGSALTSSSQYNICIGQDAGKQLQSSGDDYNIMMGYKCGVRMQSGDDAKPCVFIGSDITPTWTNGWKHTIFIGDEVGKWHTSPYGSYGDATADHSDIAIGNTHLGQYSGRNIAIGNGTMRAHYSEDSIQIGHQSTDVQSQHIDRSILIGGDIMTNQHGGHGNKAMCGNIVAIGYNAYLNGGNGSSDSDANVTIVGTSAGNTLTTGTNVTCIGYDSQASSASTTNEVTLGNSSVSTLRCNTQTISSLSDERDKKDIEDIDIGLDFINDLRPVNFTWDRRDGSMSEIKSQGFIAQEVDEVQQKYDCEDHLQAVMKENPEKLEMSYGKLVPALVKAIQELTDRVEELENGIR